ncbi:MAG: band 7 protein [Elusimicrobia bacterium]|nr:MAG: band 7 protein [Elusimicrobiota bacterium]
MTQERVVTTFSGWMMLPITLGMGLLGPGLVWLFILGGGRPVIAGVVLAFIGFLLLCGGFFTLEPNESAVCVLFGKYHGTCKTEGFRWTNPFYAKIRLSLRSRNFDGEKLKVNDKKGSPIEISAVVVWKVKDTAKAAFDVDDYAHFVRVQSDSAVRHLANQYPYDHGENEDEAAPTLRSGTDVINMSLLAELQERLNKAGVEVEEARLNHLAYAPEIAQAMLKRQQAEAVIAARKKIVEGAVSMVDMALNRLEKGNIIKMDDERKAAMVSNLLVVLCGEAEVHPVINTGTLYN